MKPSVFLISAIIFLFQSGLAASECGDAKVDACCKAPEVVKYSQPELPAKMLKPGESAEIVVRVAINEKGELVGTKTVSSSNKDIEAIVIAAIQEWEFEPSLLNGEARRATINIPFKFTVAAK